MDHLLACAKVGGTVRVWKLLLMRMYPMFLPKAPTLEELHEMLPIAHKVHNLEM